MDENDLSTEELASNNIVWAMMGQLSWMLSCTYDQVRGYPAKVILDFIRALQMGMSGIGRLNRVVPGSIVRVSPSIDTLQLALAYGSDIVCNTRVAGIDGDTGNKVINGVSFDAVIVATEAMAVKHVLANKQSKPLVFDRVQYQPSSIVLHTDTSAMPPDRKSWQALNVEIQPGSPMSQLTVWLNEYYPNVNFPEDTFETWNAFLPMKGVTKEVHFQRVVHSEHTPQLLKEIEAEQGKGGIYFAGSYSVYGMGLLEQAAISGKKAAARLLADLAAARLWRAVSDTYR
jgi:predicted NAD/FAD-binding protein